VDNRLGREIPVSAIELLEVCVRLGVPKMIFGNEEIELREEVRRRVESHSRLRLAGGIDCLAFEGSVASVSFKRYLKPKVLSSEESAILAWLDRQPSLSELMGFFHKTGPADRVAALVRSLERSRIVELCLPDDICWRMGIGRLSSEMTH
jgi:hypothetical protein